ncbi:MAG: ribokinase [Armatimonadota bacterium]
MKPKIAVVGSLNSDQVVKAFKLPAAGETVFGGEFSVFRGGKGANQAVAAARLGASVTIVGCVGGDPVGAALRDGLAAEGIDVRHVRTDDSAATGVAFITVDASGHNTIVVAAGANTRLSVADVETARDAISASQALLLQLEVPLDVVLQAARLAHSSGRLVVLDPAPAQPLPPDLYRYVSAITPNEVEARVLTGIPVKDERSAAKAAAWFVERGCNMAVIKRGANGAFLATGAIRESVTGVPVDVVDSTAAGDAFAGALGVALAEGKGPVDGVRFANVVGALSVTRMGAQPSMPRRDEVRAFANTRGLAI